MLIPSFAVVHRHGLIAIHDDRLRAYHRPRAGTCKAVQLGQYARPRYCRGAHHAVTPLRCAAWSWQAKRYKLMLHPRRMAYVYPARRPKFAQMRAALSAACAAGVIVLCIIFVLLKIRHVAGAIIVCKQRATSCHCA